MFRPTSRSGVTFIELLLFVAIVSVVGVVILPLLFASTENRMLQESIAVVENNGNQILQTLGYYIRHSERVIDPATGNTRNHLLLQTSSGASNPIVFGVATGALIMVKRTQQFTISSPQVAVLDFSVRNTSSSTTRQSVVVSFRISRTIRLDAPHTYSQKFEALFTLYPADHPQGGACSGISPGCIITGSMGRYAWQVLESGACQLASTYMQCN